MLSEFKTFESDIMNDEGQYCRKKFTCKEKLGSGAYSSVHSCVDESGKEFAVKIENSSVPQHVLMNERSIYFRVLETCKETKQDYPVGIPIVHHYAEKEGTGTRFIILERLGESLLDVMKNLGRPLSSKSILAMGSQMVERFRALHGFGIIHRDVKPDNILTGWEPDKKSILNITDFGIARVFKNASGEYSPSVSDAFDGLHIFSSHRAHKALPQTARDDLESLVFCLVFMAKGKLPWKRGTESTELGTKKETISSSELCKGLPQSVERFCNAVRDLDFMETPDYGSMKSLFEKDLAQAGPEKLDWN